jgi:hypothetical protein
MGGALGVSLEEWTPRTSIDPDRPVVAHVSSSRVKSNVSTRRETPKQTERNLWNT